MLHFLALNLKGPVEKLQVPLLSSMKQDRLVFQSQAIEDDIVEVTHSGSEPETSTVPVSKNSKPISRIR